MAERVVAYLAGGVQGTAVDARLAANFYATPNGPLKSAGGVRSPLDLIVTANTPAGMSVVVAPGQALVAGSRSSITQGAYEVANDANVVVPLTPANGTYGRIDLVVVQVFDTEQSGSPTDPNAWKARLLVVPGVAAATPVPPSLPPDSLLLANISVPANAGSIASAQITDMRVSTAALGGIRPVTFLPTTGLYNGLTVYSITADSYYGYRNGVWSRVADRRWARGRLAYWEYATPSRSPSVVAYDAAFTDPHHYTKLQEVSFVPDSGRLYRVTSQSVWQSNATDDLLILWIVLGTDTSPRTAWPLRTINSLAVANATNFTYDFPGALSAGTPQLAQLYGARLGGSGDHYINVLNGLRSFISVDDIGGT